MKFEERVLQQEFTLNDTDDLIVDYIRKNKANLEHLSIQKVAEDLYLVPNSIMRLCKKLGYKGFAEMKFLVNNEVSTKIWGCSSAGRAPALQAGGQEFDPPHLHHRASEDGNDDRTPKLTWACSSGG